MKKIKTSLILLLTALVLVMSLSACGGSSTEDKESASKTKPAADNVFDTHSEEWTEAMEYYKKFLARDAIPWTGGEEIVLSEAVQFLTEDITGDGIPELFVKIPTYCYGWIGIFTRVSGTTDDIAYCDELGGYYPGTGVFTIRGSVKSTDGSVIKTNEGYQYLKDVSEWSSGIVQWRLAIGTTETKDGTTEYYWQGVYTEATEEEWAEATQGAISQEVFESNLETLTGGVEKVEISADWADNTPENREQYLK